MQGKNVQLQRKVMVQFVVLLVFIGVVSWWSLANIRHAAGFCLESSGSVLCAVLLWMSYMFNFFAYDLLRSKVKQLML